MSQADFILHSCLLVTCQHPNDTQNRADLKINLKKVGKLCDDFFKSEQKEIIP